MLGEESFHTLLCEVENIINSRPLTVENVNDCNGPSPITPNMLLTTKTKIVRPPPGVFEEADMYSRRHWRRVQHLAEEFWSRWRKEFLQSLQERSKWKCKSRNFEVGDIVIVKSDEPRNEWPLAIVVETFADGNDTVRTVKLRLGNGKVIDRSITKLVLLKEKE